MRRNLVVALGAGLCGLVVALASGCTHQNVTFGDENTEVDIAVVFKDSTPRQAVSDFIERSLSEPAAGGKSGRALVPGIQGVSADYAQRRVYVTLESTVSSSEERSIIEVAKHSPLVDRVLLDAAPSDIPD